jgi:hypothetical protein
MKLLLDISIMNNVIEFINNAAALILLEDILLNSQF